jgi:hypothetical protein
VQTEPLLAAKVIRMANTLTLNPYRGQITSLKRCDPAHRPVGTLRCLAFAVAAEQLARDHRSRQMRLIASGLWMHSIDVAAWSCAFAHHLKRPDPDAAMLAGLMLDIGQFYLLARAARYPALEGRHGPLRRGGHHLGRSRCATPCSKPWRCPSASSPRPAPPTPSPTPSGRRPQLGDVVFLATLAAESPNPFDSLLGVRRRPELLEASMTGGIDRARLRHPDVTEARASRQELISAACG